MLIWWARYNTVIILIFTIIDHTSKWMEAIPLSDTYAGMCKGFNFYLDFPF
jgi:hypothetical protein